MGFVWFAWELKWPCRLPVLTVEQVQAWQDASLPTTVCLIGCGSLDASEQALLPTHALKQG